MTRKKYIQLPRGYLSYTQMELWQADPKRYKALYFDNRDELRVSNRGQEYGKVVADALEKGVETGDLLTDSATLLLPKYDLQDQEFFAEVKTKDGWLKLICKPDTMDSKTYVFREYKTGKLPWTREKAQNHPQMIYYAVGIWQKYGVKNEKAHLDWIETEQVDTQIVPTGRVETFEVTFTTAQYMHTLMRMIQTAKEIEIAWASHVTNPELINF